MDAGTEELIKDFNKKWQEMINNSIRAILDNPTPADGDE